MNVVTPGGGVKRDGSVVTANYFTLLRLTAGERVASFRQTRIACPAGTPWRS